MFNCLNVEQNLARSAKCCNFTVLNHIVPTEFSQLRQNRVVRDQTTQLLSFI